MRDTMHRLWEIYANTPTKGVFIDEALKANLATDREQLRIIWEAFDVASSMRRKDWKD